MSQIVTKGIVRRIEGVSVKTPNDSGAVRVKVELPGEGYKKIDDIPWAVPLLPKIFQVTPKLNESVLVILANNDNKNSNRYYIGPIIDQPQDFNYNPSTFAGKSLENGSITLGPDPNMDAEFKGAFPDPMDVAVVGRKSEDVILKDGEVDIRCGIRATTTDSDNHIKYFFNSEDHPAYIQLKHKRNLINNEKDAATSVINLVADKVNLISHKDIAKMNGNVNVTDQETLVNDQNVLQASLHPIMWGDKLAEALELFKQAFLTHVHQYGLASAPVCVADLTQNLSGTDFKEFLSKNICTS